MQAFSNDELTPTFRGRRWSIVLSLVVLACGKTPTGTTSPATGSGSNSGSGGDSGSAASAPSAGGSGSEAGTVSFACTSNAQPGDTVSVPAGDFAMGCEAQVDTDCMDDEKPLHTVSLGAFQIDRTEVTQDQYTACVQASVCDEPQCTWDCTRTDFPAACIEWSQAKAYCSWVGKRLPTEAEWEKAARGTTGLKYPWGNQDVDCTRANMVGCGDALQNVGSHPDGASPYGALDMSGNVVEMVADWYDATFYQASPMSDPTGPATGTRYVGRGGGYKSEAVWQRASSRDWYDLSDWSEPLGFRCAL